jgi:Zn-finger nucleic acid-binding protein
MPQGCLFAGPEIGYYILRRLLRILETIKKPFGQGRWINEGNSYLGVHRRSLGKSLNRRDRGRLAEIAEMLRGNVPPFAVSFAQMAKKHENFEVTCPCCSAVLKVDTETRAVIAHTAAVKPKTFNDIEAAAKAMREQDSRRESIFQQSVEAQKHASDLLEKRFQEAVKKAKESPDTGKPIRDFDLD